MPALSQTTPPPPGCSGPWAARRCQSRNLSLFRCGMQVHVTTKGLSGPGEEGNDNGGCTETVSGWST